MITRIGIMLLCLVSVPVWAAIEAYEFDSPEVEAEYNQLINELRCLVCQNQSLAEATLPAKGSTLRHYHKKSEEFYYLLEGEAQMEINGVTKKMSSGDAVLIPAGAWHQITANEDGPIRLLCCCAPPYSHEDTYFE